MEFRVGDRVKIEGVLVPSGPAISSKYPLALSLGGDHRLTLSSEGRYELDVPPILQLVERPKRKVKKQVEWWANLYTEDYMDTEEFCATKEDADRVAMGTKRIACVKLTGEYEVEE